MTLSEARLPAQADLPLLTTRRLLLRAMQLSDAPDVYAYAKVPEVLRFTTGTPPKNLDETVDFLRHALSAPADRMWAIQQRGAPAVIGALEFSLQSRTCGEIHYALAMPFWGQGLMTEAVNALCAWLFQTLPSLDEITTTVVEANVGSARVLEKCGFTRTARKQEVWAKEPEPVPLFTFRRERKAE